MKLIDKDAVMLAIEKLEDENNCGTDDFIESKRIAYIQVKEAINALKVTEEILKMKVKCVNSKENDIFKVGDIYDCFRINAGVNMYRVFNKNGSTLCSLEELENGNRFKILQKE